MLLKIYYLDDEQELLEMFSDTFSRDDREIKTFADPKKAIEEINKSRPDILFIDFRLPGITGDEIALNFPSEIPKALISGDMQVTSQYKFDAIFGKPYKTAEIEAFIERVAALKKG